VPRADFTYEVRKGVEEPSGIEDYAVRTSEGEAVGTVGGLLERSGERIVIVERGIVGVAHERRAVPWAEVESVDHAALAVWLRVDRQAFLENALELDPDLGIEQGTGAAEVRRVSDPPADLVPAPRRNIVGPVDRPFFLLPIALLGLGAFSAFAVVVLLTFREEPWLAALFVIPAALLAAAALTGYRLYRNPYEPQGSAKP
jgi:hypothetical protein